ncbi:membrane protein [Porphyromonadaceae bacterium COT-184 OH4590]|nr:membrane protein [Porphyromonadaceae bacterium COT-184 OH4590]
MEILIPIFSSFFALRLVSLAISIKNEKKIITQGGIQHGKLNSMLITLAHIAFYFSCLFEAYIGNHWQFDGIAQIGLGLLLFAYIILFCVIYQLRNIWTLKIYILPKHKINTSFLFKWVKHPNYFLNIIPELIGMAILCKASITFCVLFPVYLVLLFKRIKQEEKAMQHLM